MSLSKIVEDLRFHFACKLTSGTATGSWMLAEDTRLLGQRQTSVLLTAQPAA